MTNHLRTDIRTAAGYRVQRGRLAVSLVKTALLTAALLAGVGTDAAAQGSISGRVTGPGSVPLPHPVVLWIFDFQGDAGFESTRTTSDALGNYAINLPASSYAIITQNADGYINEIYNNIPCSAVCDTTNIAPIVVTNGPVSGIDFVLDPGGGRISGTVTRADGVTPIEGVIVGFIGPDAEIPFSFAVTDASGNYISEGGSVNGNVYAATFNTPGFRDEIYDNIYYCDCNPADVGATLIPVTLGMTTGGRNFALDAGGSISGTVTNSSGTPLPNVEVNILDSTGNNLGQTETDASGNYITGGLPAGNYYVVTQNRVGLVDEVYNDIPCIGGFCNVVSSGGTLIPVTVGATASGINFVLAAGGTISGTVTEAVGGAPVNGLFVGFFTATGNQTNYVGGTHTSGGGTGAYSIVVPPGTYFAAVLNEETGTYGNQIYSGLTCADNSCNPGIGTPLSVTTGGSINNVNFALVGRGSISGTVTNAAGGVPLNGVQVQVLSLSGTVLGNQATNVSGAYIFTGLAIGSYYVRTNTGQAFINQLHSGVVCVQCNVVTSGGTPVPVTANTTTTINFALDAGGRITGTVTNASTLANIQGISVQFFNAVGVQMGAFGSNASGVYTSSGLPAGTYYVKTAANASQNFLDEVWNDIPCVPCAVTTGTPVIVTGTATTMGINFALLPGGSISGTITDAGTGAPVSAVPVLAFDANGVLLKNISSDAVGVYTIGGLPTGNYFVRTNPNAPTLNYGSQLYNGIPYNGLPLIGTPVDVTAGGTHTGVNFALVSGGSLSGTVKDAGTNAPLAGVQMAVYSPAGRPIKFPQTDLTGSFTVTGLPAGTYYVSTSVPNSLPPFYIDELYDNASCLGCVTIGAAALPNVTLPNGAPTVTTGTAVVVTNGTTRTGVNFLLATGGGIISGAVTDAATGIGLLNVAVSVYNAAGVLVKTVTSVANTGAYIVRGLAPGTYYARTIVSPATPYYTDEAYDNVPCAPCTVTTTSPITVTANSATTGVDFALAPGGSMTGLVTDAATTNPLASVDVQLYNAAGNLVKTTFSGSVGTFRLDGLAAGTYYARTAVPASLAIYVNELYDNIPCLSCTVTTGTAIVVTNGSTRSGVNFALVANAPPTITSVPNSVTPVSTPIVVNFTVGDVESGAAGVSVAAASSNTTLVPNANLVLGGSGAARTLTITPAAGRSGVTSITLTASDGVRVVSTSFGLVVGTPVRSGDFDGDGKADVTIYRPSNGGWYVLRSSTGTPTAAIWGNATDIPVPGDYDGDGKIDFAIFRPSNGGWYVLRSSTGTPTAAIWGNSTDKPVPGDYDGDGKTDVAIYRPSNGGWYVLNSSTGTPTAAIWGSATDVPVQGDYDGDGKTDTAIYRPSNGGWYILNSNGGTPSAFIWGSATDISVPGDYDGDGKSDAAIFRPSNGGWYVLKSGTGTPTAAIWGNSTDVPVPGDFDGDGKTDFAIFRPSNGGWYILKSATGTPSALIWGNSTDIPVLRRP